MESAGEIRSILIVVENLPVPFDRRVWMEATTLRDAGYNVAVISPTGKGYDKEYEIIENIHIKDRLFQGKTVPLGEGDANIVNVLNNNNTNIEFYQKENLRLSKELYDVQKKAVIMKEEIEKFEAQRANLVTKINSVNDVIRDTNVLTNVFENSVKKNQIEVLDYKAEQNKNIKKDLSEEVKKIFSNT